jgi:hypothetical protein
LGIGRGVARPTGLTALVQQLLGAVVAITPVLSPQLLHLSAQRILLLRLGSAPRSVLTRLLDRTARIAVETAGLLQRIGLRAIFISAASKFTV